MYLARASRQLDSLSHPSFKAGPQRTGRTVCQVPDPRLAHLQPRDNHPKYLFYRLPVVENTDQKKRGVY